MKQYKSNITYFILGIALTSVIILLGFSDKSSHSQTTQTELQTMTPSVVLQDLYVPETVSIFGEKVPVEYFDVAESLDRELLINVFWQSQTIQFVKYVHRYFPIIDSILRANKIPADFKYLALAESGLRINISPKGAAGFWQFLETTGKEYGLTVTEQIDQRYDLIKSTEAACKYLQRAYTKFGSWTLVAASYNVGMGGLDKQLQFQNIKSYYDLHTNSETGRYVFRIIALKLILENLDKYGYQELQPYTHIPYSIVTVDSTIANLAEFSVAQGSNYKLLKMMNPWLRDKHLPNASKTPYNIIIVKNNDRNFK